MSDLIAGLIFGTGAGVAYKAISFVYARFLARWEREGSGDPTV
jgi:hypothetical protein